MVSKLHQSHAGLLIIRGQTQVMIPLVNETTSIGRKQADIIIDDVKASSLHAEIIKLPMGFKIVDLNSTNGTFLNRHPISESPLTDQDVIEIGETTICFFADVRDFHGVADEVSVSVKAKESPAPDQTQQLTYVTSTKTLHQAQIELKILSGKMKDKVLKFQKSSIIIGRVDADLMLDDLDASRNHALIEVLSEKNVFLKDLDSTNGTILNGKKISVERLKNGDQIEIGNTKIQVIILKNS